MYNWYWRKFQKQEYLFQLMSNGNIIDLSTTVNQTGIEWRRSVTWTNKILSFSLPHTAAILSDMVRHMTHGKSADFRDYDHHFAPVYHIMRETM